LIGHPTLVGLRRKARKIYKQVRKDVEKIKKEPPLGRKRPSSCPRAPKFVKKATTGE